MKSKSKKLSPIQELQTEIACAQAMINHRKSILKTFDQRHEELLRERRRIDDRIDQLIDDHETAEETIIEYQKRIQQYQIRINTMKQKGMTERTLLTPEEKKLRKLARLKKQMADLQAELGMEEN